MVENYEPVFSNKFASFISDLNHIAHCGHLKLTSLVDLVNPKIHLVQEDGEEKQSCNLLAVQRIVQYGCSSSGIWLWDQINYKHHYVIWTLASKWDTKYVLTDSGWICCSSHLMLSWLIFQFQLLYITYISHLLLFLFWCGNKGCSSFHSSWRIRHFQYRIEFSGESHHSGNLSWEEKGIIRWSVYWKTL